MSRTPEAHSLSFAPRQMKDQLQSDKRYAGTFAWTSQVTYSSILALSELATAVDGAGDDLLTRAGMDDKGNALLYYALWTIFYFVGSIEICSPSASRGWTTSSRKQAPSTNALP